MYIWETKNWPLFHWDTSNILKALSLAKTSQGYIFAQADVINLKDQGELIVNEALTTSSIEGHLLDKNSVRSSVARRLGLPTAGLPEHKGQNDGLVEVLIDAVRNYKKPLTKERLWGWQAALFPTGYSGMFKIRTGGWRTDRIPMRVVSGSIDKETIHFEAPPANVVDEEMESFLAWWNTPHTELDGLLRAGIAHLWFVTIHPFADGNGRIARAITDLALAQEEQTSKRLYSLSFQINKDKTNYYTVLEKTQKNGGDITKWLNWFLGSYTKSIEYSGTLFEKSIFTGKFYQYIARIVLNERQIKVLRKLLECYPAQFIGGMTNKKYAAITKVSSETAKRDLKDLINKHLIFHGQAGGRSTSYQLNCSIIDI